MNKKFQVFVSSTYTDLKIERQACVEAILRAGHIPAGMELFSAGDETQLETIKRWIQDSDIYVLLLAGRYGTIEPTTGFSYTEVEYRYAVEQGKPFFALVMTDKFLDEKIMKEGRNVLEQEHPIKLKAFKALVLSKTSHFFDNLDQLKLSIFQSLGDIQSRHTLIGWVRANDVVDSNKVLNQLSELNEKNKFLENQLKALEDRNSERIGEFTYEEIMEALENVVIDYQYKDGEIKLVQKSALSLLIDFKDQLIKGINTRPDNSILDDIFSRLIPQLGVFGLIQTHVNDFGNNVYRLTILGNKFTILYSKRKKGK